MVLASADLSIVTAEKFANMADKVMEVAATAPSISAVDNTHTRCMDNMQSDIKQLRQEVSHLTELVSHSPDPEPTNAACPVHTVHQPPDAIQHQHRSHSAGTTKSLERLPKSARSHATGAHRPHVSGDKQCQPQLQSPPIL